VVDKFVHLIEGIDPSVFQVASQLSDADKRSLLYLQNIVRSCTIRYTYLEVGSHVGGSLFPHLIDPRCGAAVSLDPRPPSQPDERGQSFDYEDNSTDRMIRTLEKFASHGAMLKLRTYDIDASQIPATGDAIRATLALIDGEHTNRAVFRDFLSILSYMETDAIVVFHDSNLIFDALMNIETFLTYSERPFSAFYLPDNVYAVALGGFVNVAEHGLRHHAFDAETFTANARNNLDQFIAKNLGLRSASRPVSIPS